MYFKIYSLLLVCILSYHSTGFAADLVLKFGVYGSDRKSEIQRKFSPLLIALEKQLSKSLDISVGIELVYFEAYEDGIEAVVKGNVDFSRLGPVSYVIAKNQNPRLSILAIEANKGKKSFQGVICVKRSSTIKTLADLKGKMFAFGNKRSTSGRFMSQKFLYEQGLKASDFESYTYYLKHDDVAFAIAQGYQDAGAFKGGILKNKFMNNSLRVIAEFPVIAHPWVLREHVADNIKKQLKAALLTLDQQQAYRGLKRDGFVDGNDSEYNDIRESMMKNYLFFE